MPGHYSDGALVKLYLKDRREAKGEVGRLDGDPLYNAQDIEIKNFSVSASEMARGEARVTIFSLPDSFHELLNLRSDPMPTL